MTDPVAEFRAAAASSERMFWLDGGGARPWSGTRSVIGALADNDVSLTYDAASRTVVRHRSGGSQVVGDDIFAVLERELALDGGDPSVSWVGYLGYACRPDLPARPAAAGSPPQTPEGSRSGPLTVPDAVLMRVRDPLILVEPPKVAAPRPQTFGGSARVGAATFGGSTPEGYQRAFEEVQRQLRLGNSYEVNLTYREQIESGVDPVTAYLRLRGLNPAPYSGYLQHPVAGGSVHLLSSSPERFATVDRLRVLEAKPIKGTTPRGETEEADEEQRRRLATDPRFRAENLMIVDLLRNDLSMVCEPGTVTVPLLMDVESYESVHQLVSTVRGRLRDDVGTVAALRALFPAGSMTGAPKRRTMEIIDGVEATPRGVYAGAFGWLSADGRADLSVVIRTLVGVRAGPAAWRYELGTGGGVTVKSTAQEEYAESRWKADRLRAALDG